MARKTDGARQRLKPIIARHKKLLARHKKLEPSLSPLQKAAQAFALDPENPADRDKLLVHLAEALYGPKRKGGRPTVISDSVILEDIARVERIEWVRKTDAATIAVTLREKHPEQYLQIGDRALRQRVVKLLRRDTALRQRVMKLLRRDRARATDWHKSWLKASRASRASGIN